MEARVPLPIAVEVGCSFAHLSHGSPRTGSTAAIGSGLSNICLSELYGTSGFVVRYYIITGRAPFFNQSVRLSEAACQRRPTRRPADSAVRGGRQGDRPTVLSEAAGKETGRQCCQRQPARRSANSAVRSDRQGDRPTVLSVSGLREAAINIAGSENVIDTAIVISGEFNDDMDRSAPAVRLVVTIGGRGNVQHL